MIDTLPLLPGPLHLCIEAWNTSFLTQWLNTSTDATRIEAINFSSSDVGTPLCVVAACHKSRGKGKLKLVDHLIEAGARAEKQDNNGTTPLHITIIHDDSGFVEIILKKISGGYYARVVAEPFMWN
ncbi:hypothetical protein ACP4OV_030716 [Aristida adscensionis]